MRPLTPSKSSEAGFTLTELTIVLIIVGLLLGGLLMPLSAQMDLRDARTTQTQLTDASDALLGFAISYGRLPCPADPAQLASSATAGIEDCSLTVTAKVMTGALPWADLGLTALDGWGRRLTYIVDEDFVDPVPGTSWANNCGAGPVPVPVNATFALCSDARITITDGATNLSLKIPAVVLSHGKNGLGGYNADGALIAIAGATADEQENADKDATLVLNTGAGFDDMLIWLSPNILKNRMLNAGRLP